MNKLNRWTNNLLVGLLDAWDYLLAAPLAFHWCLWGSWAFVIVVFIFS